MFVCFDPEHGYLSSIEIDSFETNFYHSKDIRIALEGDREFFEVIYRLFELDFSDDYLVPSPF